LTPLPTRAHSANEEIKEQILLEAGEERGRALCGPWRSLREILSEDHLPESPAPEASSVNGYN
jgi:hypothetical protein